MNSYFEYYIESNTFHLKYAKRGTAIKGQEFHNYHELVFFLDGKARLISKNIQKDLKIGSLVLVPKASFHQFVVSGNDYTRLILGFRETNEIAELIKNVMNEVNVIEEPNEVLLSSFHNLKNVFKSDLSQNEKELFVCASLVHILIYLKEYSKGRADPKNELSSTVQKALSYIDGHYTESISVESVADAVHISASQLFHRFKGELKISVYQYISKKRLANARLLIEAGATVSDAAINSGFNDYSVFFRMYKKYYGAPPSKLRPKTEFIYNGE